MREHGVQIESWGPFAEGKNDLFTNPTLTEIGGAHGKSVAQVVLRWLIQRDVVVIPKSVRPDRMAENLDVFDFELTDDEMTRIAALDTGASAVLRPPRPRHGQLARRPPRRLRASLRWLTTRRAPCGAVPFSPAPCSAAAGAAMSGCDTHPAARRRAADRRSRPPPPEAPCCWPTSPARARTTRTAAAGASTVGNTQVVAEMIGRLIGCDVHRIEAADPYPDDYDPTVERNVREQDADARPAMANPLTSIERYDTVLLGSPIWNVRAPMIMSTFTESLDFTGKTIHPFTTHAMSGLGTTERDYAASCPGATLGEGLAVRGEEAADAGPAVESWLRRIGLR